MTWTGWRTASSGRVGTVWLHSGQTVPPSTSVQPSRSRQPEARQMSASSVRDLGWRTRSRTPRRRSPMAAVLVSIAVPVAVRLGQRERPAGLADTLDAGEPPLQGGEPALVRLLHHPGLGRAHDRGQLVLLGQLQPGQAVFDEGQPLGTDVAGRSVETESPGDISKSGRDADRKERRSHKPTTARSAPRRCACRRRYWLNPGAANDEHVLIPLAALVKQIRTAVCTPRRTVHVD